MTLPDHTSPSQLGTYASCPRKFEYRYVERAPAEFRSVSLALGTVVHGVIEWWFGEQRAGREPTVEEAMRILRADFAAATNHEELRWGRWTPNDLRDHAGRLVRTFLEHLGHLEVREAEMRFEIPIYDTETGESLGRPLVGYFDLVLGEGRVLEVKTARSEYSPLDLTTSLQFGAYLYAIDRLWGQGELDLAVVIKNRAPRLQRLKLHPTERGERWFLEAAAKIEAAIQSGHFPPAPGFGCASCEFQERCLGVAARKAA